MYIYMYISNITHYSIPSTNTFTVHLTVITFTGLLCYYIHRFAILLLHSQVCYTIITFTGLLYCYIHRFAMDNHIHRSAILLHSQVSYTITFTGQLYYYIHRSAILLEDYNTILLYYYTILYYTILYYTVYYTILYYTYTILYYTTTILYYTVLYYTILYCTVLLYTISQLSQIAY